MLLGLPAPSRQYDEDEAAELLLGQGEPSNSTGGNTEDSNRLVRVAADEGHLGGKAGRSMQESASFLLGCSHLDDDQGGVTRQPLGGPRKLTHHRPHFSMQALSVDVITFLAILLGLVTYFLLEERNTC